MTKQKHTMRAIGRREFVVATAAGAGLLALGATARPALAATPESKTLLEQLTKGKAKEGRITLRLPEIAENGNTVPIALAVESPMTAQDYVKKVTVLADGNPNPRVAELHFGPNSGKADVQLRIRLAQTQNIVAVAEMSNGSLWTASKEIKVTIGGRGG